MVSFFVLSTGGKYYKVRHSKRRDGSIWIMISSEFEKHHDTSRFTLPNLRSFPFFRRGGLTFLIVKQSIIGNNVKSRLFRPRFYKSKFFLLTFSPKEKVSYLLRRTSFSYFTISSNQDLSATTPHLVQYSAQISPKGRVLISSCIIISSVSLFSS